MGSQFWWMFDALVIFIAVWIVYSNAKKGMTKALILCIGYILATVSGSVLSAAAAPTLYEVMARDSNLEAIQEVNSSIDIPQCFLNALDAQEYGTTYEKGKIVSCLLPPNTDQFDRSLYQYVNHKCGYEVATQQEFKDVLCDAFVESYAAELHKRLPYYVAMEFREKMAREPALIHTIMVEFFRMHATDQDRAAFIEEQFSCAPTTETFRIIIYFVIFSVVMLFAALISNAVQYKMFFNILSGTDHFLGALLGLIEAAVMLILLTFVVRLLVLIGGGELLCLNEQTVEATKLFHYIYDQLDLLL